MVPLQMPDSFEKIEKKIGANVARTLSFVVQMCSKWSKTGRSASKLAQKAAKGAKTVQKASKWAKRCQYGPIRG